MNSSTTDYFWKCYLELPIHIKRKAKECYKLFKENPYHPSLHFKKVHSIEPIYSIRITIKYRALGVLGNNEVIWFWIGSHVDYENLIKRNKEVGMTRRSR